MLYKLKRHKPKKQILPFLYNITTPNVKTLIIPNEDKHIVIIAFTGELRIISSTPLFGNTEFCGNDINNLDLTSIGVHPQMINDSGAYQFVSNFYYSNDIENEQVLDTPVFLDGTPFELDDINLAVLTIDKSTNYIYELTGRNFILTTVDKDLDIFNGNIQLNSPKNDESIVPKITMAQNIDLYDFEIADNFYPCTNEEYDLLTLQRIQA